MRIEVLKNRETSLVIDDIGKSISEEGILGEGYEKAINALDRYVEQTKRIREQLKSADSFDSQINDILYQSGHNIIAFSGKRGTGKTSAMISFAEFLKKHGEGSSQSKEQWEKHFEGMRTLVLSPIDPTMLENDQNILSVVLSRLLYKSEERWSQNPGFYHNLQNLEKEKNDLLRKANACLNGIKAIKNKSDIDSLAALQKIGDSAVLKKNLFDLVDMVNHFCLGDARDGTKCTYLVIPIDDTDCQIQKAHEVMEDIRRYLTIPNVLILMATDGDMLRTDFAQHYASAFEAGIKNAFLNADEMERYAEKYLTKLIPGTHRVYLPIFENVLKENSVTLELGYYENNDRNKDLISGSFRTDREAKRKNSDYSGIDFDFQAKVLDYIYQKTGIVFFEHTAYMNNIIPTTMRGLAHLLNFLESMGEVKEIDFSLVNDQEDFRKVMGERFKAIEKNLDLFEEYFLNEWAPAKIPGKKAKALKEIEEQVPENLIQYVYDENKPEDKKNDDPDDFKEATYYDLMDLLGGRNGTVSESGYVGKRLKHKTDFYESFAIRTLITIKKNKWAVRIRQRALENAIVNTTGTDVFGVQFSSDDFNNLFPEGKKNEGGSYGKNLMPIVEAYRSLLLDEIETENVTESTVRYQIQEMAWIVLCNWDVQEIIYKSVEKNRNGNAWSEPKLWEAVQSEIASRNCKMLKSIIEKGAVQIKEWPAEYKNLLKNSGKTKKGSAGAAAASSDPEKDIRNNIKNIITLIGNRRGVDKDVLLGAIDSLCVKLTELGPKLSPEVSADEDQKLRNEMYVVIDNYIEGGKTIKADVEVELQEEQKQESSSVDDHFRKLSQERIDQITKWTGEISDWLERIEGLVNKTGAQQKMEGPAEAGSDQ